MSIYQLLLAEDGSVLQAAQTNSETPGAVVVDEDAFLAAMASLQASGAWFRDGVVVPKPVSQLPAVDAERDRRMRVPFLFRGVAYDADDISQARIEKARLSALAAVAAGAQLGDFEWPGAGLPFAWIAADNVPRPMDAQTTVAFGSVPVAREGLLIMAARAIKDRILAGEQIDDVTDDALWSLPA